ncbi:hypothetical protein EGI22_21835 [Lacihabitans sp. LS3-19]|uniref:hypothetical protein n=1 Tax=Lacihabitans sp. LS3-19 TaxID=2487335 RepID=UPI0020CDA64B|nr:hypothetical protein [Lacihabitans sp. LS3-19]MCP9770557.1 hypothetical protein [Lacihabitans sp. LS3-19]
MKIISKTLKVIGISIGVFFIAFLVYANWEPKPLHAYAKNSQLSIYKLNEEADEAQFEYLNDKIEKIKGISAVAGNVDSQMLSVVFYPDEITESKVNDILKSENLKFEKADFSTDTPPGPQCPVPMEYIQNLEKIKFAFNIR